MTWQSNCSFFVGKTSFLSDCFWLSYFVSSFLCSFTVMHLIKCLFLFIQLKNSNDSLQRRCTVLYHYWKFLAIYYFVLLFFQVFPSFLLLELLMDLSIIFILFTMMLNLHIFPFLYLTGLWCPVVIATGKSFSSLISLFSCV